MLEQIQVLLFQKLAILLLWVAVVDNKSLAAILLQQAAQAAEQAVLLLLLQVLQLHNLVKILE
jgi:hypothetical protein